MATLNRVNILGSGAIGMALAVHLLQQNREVLLIKTSQDDVSEKKITISMRTGQDNTRSVAVTMLSLSKIKDLSGIIVIATKTYANDKIAKELAQKNITSPLVIIQNGLGIERPYLELDFPEIYRCILFASSQKIQDTFVQYKPIAPSPIGIIKGNTQTLQRIVSNLHTPNFSFVVEHNIQEKIWQKAIINSVFNSICPLLEIDNGIFIRNAAVTELALEIITECVAVASGAGIDLNIDQLQQQIQKISQASDGQFISTLQDLQQKRETEITALNLEIARIADMSTIKISIEKTRLLGKMILLKSELGLIPDS